MPFSKENERKIIKNRKAIIEGIKHDGIVDILVSEFVLTQDDEERIETKATQMDKNRELIRLLVKGPAQGYDIFIKTLKEDKAYEDLAIQIDETEIPEEKPQTFEDWLGRSLIPEIEQQYLIDKKLMKFASAINPLNIAPVGACLEMSDVDVKNLEYSHPRSGASVCFGLLMKWRNKIGHKATFRSLLEKLFQASTMSPDCLNDEIIRTILKEEYDECVQSGKTS